MKTITITIELEDDDDVLAILEAVREQLPHGSLLRERLALEIAHATGRA